MHLIQIAHAEPTLPSPAPPEFHVIQGTSRLLFAVHGSRLYALEDDEPDAAFPDYLHSSVSPAAKVEPEPHAISLNIAQSCNLACHYCYADEGKFGGKAMMMTLDTAKTAIRRHIRQATRGPVSVGFIGGEPFLNREVLHAATRFAVAEAAAARMPITFGITTNGTLLEPADIDLLRAHPFAVNVSLDGAREVHDSLRPTHTGAGSFERVMRAVGPLLASPGKAWVAARVTVTRRNLDVQSHIEALAAAGFSEIGVSPMRSGPDPMLRLSGDDWLVYLANLKAAATADWRRVKDTRESLRFSNFSNALRQIYRGACNALPCGSAADYVSLSAGGRYYTCHRTVGDEDFQLGDLAEGPSPDLRRKFVESRTVDLQEPCRSCWARYLCGGGCHAEVMTMGRDGCDSIRGWLEFCISLYPEVLAARPDLLDNGTPQGSLQ